MKVHRHTMSGVFTEDTNTYLGNGYFDCSDADMMKALESERGVIETGCSCCGAKVVLVRINPVEVKPQ